MIGETPPLPPLPSLKGKSLADAHRERMEAKPDVWTLHWWKREFDGIDKLYRALSHMLNLTVSNMLSYSERVDGLQERLEAVEGENKLLLAKIGELQSELTIAMKRIDDMAEWAKKQKKPAGGDVK